MIGPATYPLAAKSLRDVGTTHGHRGDISFADYAMRHTAGFGTNKRLPDAANDIQQAILHLEGGTGIRTAVWPHWSAVSIDDVYNESASGTRYVTFRALRAGDPAAGLCGVAYGLAV